MSIKIKIIASCVANVFCRFFPLNGETRCEATKIIREDETLLCVDFGLNYLFDFDIYLSIECLTIYSEDFSCTKTVATLPARKKFKQCVKRMNKDNK